MLSVKSGRSSTDGESRDARSCKRRQSHRRRRRRRTREEEEEEVEVVGDLSREKTRVKAFLSEFQVPHRERNIRVFSEICGTACKTFVTPSRLINAPT